MGAPQPLLVLPFRGARDPRFVPLRRKIDAMATRLRQVSRTLPDDTMRPLPSLRPRLRLLP